MRRDTRRIWRAEGLVSALVMDDSVATMVHDSPGSSRRLPGVGAKQWRNVLYMAC